MNSIDLPDIATMNRREALRRATLLLGIAISPSLLTGVMHAEIAALAPQAAAKPAFLTAEQFEIAGAIAERILPRTDTPGALDVGVPKFMDLMFGKFMTEVEKKSFTAGLADLESASTPAHKAGFVALPPEKQDALLQAVAGGAEAKRAFFKQIKEFTVLGYFTSETVGKTVLNYNPVPGRYDACIPLAEVGNRSWTK